MGFNDDLGGQYCETGYNGGLDALSWDLGWNGRARWVFVSLKGVYGHGRLRTLKQGRKEMLLS